MNAPAPALCTCVGCSVRVSRLVVHAWQDVELAERGTWRPCPGCEICQCPNPAAAEDLLCLSCHLHHGVSRFDIVAVEAMRRVLVDGARP